VKVCDFGLARFRTMNHLMSLGQLRGTMQYCPPEIYEGHIFSTKSDIYSVAIVLWELVVVVVTGAYQTPFEEYKDIEFEFQIITRTAKQQLRPTLPKGCPKSIAELIQQCWQGDPEQRPTCKELLSALQVLELEYVKDHHFFESYCEKQ